MALAKCRRPVIVSLDQSGPVVAKFYLPNRSEIQLFVAFFIYWVNPPTLNDGSPNSTNFWIM